jgi:hypothetical protein
MIDRRKQALYELSTAIAQSVVDEWLDGALACGDLETQNDKGCQHESADKTKSPPKRDKSTGRATATKGLPNVRRSRR